MKNEIAKAIQYKNCKRCGKPFSTILDYNICPDCTKEEERRFQRARDFIFDNNSAKMDEVIEFCNVTRTELTRWIREERLVLAEDSPLLLPCENCNTPIHGGRFCYACKKKFYAPQGTAVPEPDPSNEKMRFLSRK